MSTCFNNRILVIDDDQDIWQTFRTVLVEESRDRYPAAHEFAALARSDGPVEQKKGFELACAPQGKDGFEMVQEALACGCPYALAFIDIRMPPGWDGMETAARIRQIDPNIEIVIITAFSDRSRAEIVENVGTPDKLLFLRKPFDPEELTQFAVSLTAKWDLAMREEEQRASLAGVLAASSAAIITVDSTCRVLSWNRAAETITGYGADKAVNRACPLKQCNDEGRCNTICFNSQQGGNSPLELEIHDAAGNAKTILLSSGPIMDRGGRERRVVTFLDISAYKELEYQLFQAQKMDAIGSLAGGIAHDLSNMLTPVIGFNDLAKLELGSQHKAYSCLQGIEESAYRATGLLRRILAFSRKQSPEPLGLDLNQVIQDFAKMLRRLIPEDIELSLELAPDLRMITADRGQMEQVIMNLVVNARDALPSGGKIVVSTANQDADPPSGSHADRSRPGPVLLRVSDNGSGMDEETAALAFDPFFSTKAPGQGTGMGLATVNGIVKQYDGFIHLETALGRGTTFAIYLPGSVENKGSDEEDEQQEPVPGGNETVLLAEDAPELLQLAQITLEHFGYGVVAVDNGKEALECFNREPGRFDIIVTDLVMPLLNGRELAKAAWEKSPELPVLFMTGYNSRMDISDILTREGTALMRKPFNIAQLTKMVRELLGQEPLPEVDSHA